MGKYIGSTPQYGILTKQDLVPNGVTTTYSLDYQVGSAESMLVVYGGVVQTPNDDYTIASGGSQIVFAVAKAGGFDLYVLYLAREITTPVATNNFIGSVTITDDLSLGGPITITGASPSIKTNTSDGSDTKSIILNSNGATTPLSNRGSWIQAYGNEFPSHGGHIDIISGNASGSLITIDSSASNGTIAIKTNATTRWTVATSGDLQSNATNGGDVIFSKQGTGLKFNNDSRDCQIDIRNFGYSSGYKAMFIGTAATGPTVDAASLWFNVDLSANAGASFGGAGSEYYYRNRSSFCTPNVANDNFLSYFSLYDGEFRLLAGTSGNRTWVFNLTSGHLTQDSSNGGHIYFTRSGYGIRTNGLDLTLGTESANAISFSINSSTRWSFDSSGNLLQNASNGGDFKMSKSGTSIIAGATSIDSDITAVSGTGVHFYSQINNSTTANNIAIVGNGNNAVGSNIWGFKTRGTGGDANTIVQSGDALLGIVALGSDGASYRRAGHISFEVDGTPGSADMPGRIVFGTTADGASAPVTRWTLNCSGGLVQDGTNGASITINKTQTGLIGPSGGILALNLGASSGTFNIKTNVGGDMWTYNASGQIVQDATNGGDIVLAKTGSSIQRPQTLSISAAGANQGAATALTNTINFVTTVSAGTGVALKSAAVGQEQFVANHGSNHLLVYPASGDSINGLSVNIPIALYPGQSLHAIAVDSTNWLAIVGGKGNVQQGEAQLSGSIGNSSYIVTTKARYAYKINGVYGIKSTSGTGTLAIKINGVDITGLNAIAVTSTPQDVTASGANTVSIGDQVTYAFTSTSSLTDIFSTLDLTRI